MITTAGGAGPSDLFYEQQLAQYLAGQEANRDTDEEESEY